MTKSLTYDLYYFIQYALAYDVSEVVISPGSRSTPLALAFEAHPKIKTWIHPDERSAAFFALGRIKASQRPVMLLCTSGTATANYFPAIIEADLMHYPLIVLTADRPHELRQIGAPQTIQQLNLYSDKVRYFREMPLSEMASVNATAMLWQNLNHIVMSTNSGPIHLNFPFREPLVIDLELFKQLTTQALPKVNLQQSQVVYDEQQLLHHYLFYGNGLIVTAGDLSEEAQQVILQLLDRYHLIVLADITSPLRRYQHESIIVNYDLMLTNDQWVTELQPQFILRIGEPNLSKRLNQTLLAWQQIPQMLIQHHYPVKSYPCATTLTLVGDIAKILTPYLATPLKQSNAWQQKWLALSWQVQNVQDKLLSENVESSYVAYLINELVSREAIVFLGNSMPIRYADMFATHHAPHLIANRGANGIDGIVSTALGIAAQGKKVTLLIGDLSLYHDLNGLIMTKLYEIDIDIIVFNNNGGGIFSYLPQAQETLYFEKLFATPLDLNFEHAAKLYQLDYYKVTALNEFLNLDWQAQGCRLIEVMTDRQLNIEAVQKLISDIKAL